MLPSVGLITVGGALIPSWPQLFLTRPVLYAELYLQTPAQLDHACNMLLESELFAFHSERMSEMVLKDAEMVRVRCFPVGSSMWRSRGHWSFF